MFLALQGIRKASVAITPAGATGGKADSNSPSSIKSRHSIISNYLPDGTSDLLGVSREDNPFADDFNDADFSNPMFPGGRR